MGHTALSVGAKRNKNAITGSGSRRMPANSCVPSAAPRTPAAAAKNVIQIVFKTCANDT